MGDSENSGGFEAITVMVDGFLHDRPANRPMMRCPPRKRPAAKATDSANASDRQSVTFAVTELYGALKTRKQALVKMQGFDLLGQIYGASV